MKILTGNDLLTGHVLWWTADGWGARLDAAIALDADTGAVLLEREKAAERVNDLALIDAERDGGGWRPRRIRERIRGLGPTVRPDLVSGGEASVRERI